jgi:diketogulonate reductase-like aldo/keto reductase
MRAFELPDGSPVPRLGQGTWRMGERPARRREEVAALVLGLDLGLTLIDTAEMYAEGGAEERVGEAIAGRRSQAYLVSKVYPHNATRTGAIAACERSLRRLGTDYLDLYLLHWRGDVPLAETLAAFAALRDAGKVRDYGVSNFDVEDLDEIEALGFGGALATNQVLYNLEHRGVEWQLLGWCRARGLPVMAYSPLGSSASGLRRLLGHASVRAVAARHEATPAQVVLAWALRQPDVYVIPKAAGSAHVRENRAALELGLSTGDLDALDAAFPPPRRKVPLELL